MSIAALRTLIVDDEAIARERMRLQCVGIDGLVVVGTAGDGDSALNAIDSLTPDLLLLDISMPGLDGMAVAAAVNRSARPSAIVFCTANDGHALAAFDVSAVDYLLKPVSRDRLVRAVEKTRLLRSQSPMAPKPQWVDHFWVPHRGAMLRVAVADLDWVEAERDYVRLWTGSVSYLLLDTLTRIESRLDPAVFIRLRRSAIVRRALIRSVRHDGAGAWNALLADGTAIRVGPTFLPDLKAVLKA